MSSWKTIDWVLFINWNLILERSNQNSPIWKWRWSAVNWVWVYLGWSQEKCSLKTILFAVLEIYETLIIQWWVFICHSWIKITLMKTILLWNFIAGSWTLLLQERNKVLLVHSDKAHWLLGSISWNFWGCRAAWCLKRFGRVGCSWETLILIKQAVVFHH